MIGYIKNFKHGFSVIAVLLTVAALALILGGGWYMKEKVFTKQTTEQKACTQEAKQCPDGSYVGRTGPNCEFAVCPNATSSQSQVDTSTWKTYRNEKYGFEFNYPNGWLVEVDRSGAIYFHDSKEEMATGISLTPSTKKIEDIVSEIKQDLDVVTEKTEIFNSLSWKVYLFSEKLSGMEFIDAFTSQNGITVQIGGVRNNVNAFLNQILSTFKFISPSASAAGALSGKVSIGPICPVETIPPRPECMPTPEAYASREFLVLSADQSKTITSFHADATGNYSVSLPPGNYVVVSLKTGIGYRSRDLPSTITIRAGKTLTLGISVDTGIR